eukprot:6195056-Pleurochrysis_carterae.AAC.2
MREERSRMGTRKRGVGSTLLRTSPSHWKVVISTGALRDDPPHKGCAWSGKVYEAQGEGAACRVQLVPVEVDRKADKIGVLANILLNG